MSTNELTAKIHNGGANAQRMPLILHPEHEQAWLQPNQDRQTIISLFQPFPADLMAAYPIKNDFLKKHPTDPSIFDAA